MGIKSNLRFVILQKIEHFKNHEIPKQIKTEHEQVPEIENHSFGSIKEELDLNESVVSVEYFDDHGLNFASSFVKQSPLEDITCYTSFFDQQLY